MINHMHLERRLCAFLKACPFGYHFTAGNPVPLPSAAERRFLEALDVFPQLPQEELQGVRDALQYKDFYVLTTFALRMGILAARKRSRTMFRRAVVAFLIDNHLVDYRDVLARIAVLNDCATRLRMDLEDLVRPYEEFTYPCRWRLMQGFFNREPEHKEVRCFGLSAWEGPNGLEYA